MPKITKVSAQQKRKRYNIFVDGTYRFSVSPDTLAKFVLVKGAEFTDDELNKIQSAEQDNKLYTLALNYLSYEPRTVSEVTTYLTEKEASEDQIEQVLAHLIDLNLLNDEHYVELFINHNFAVGQDGPVKVKSKLLAKGIAPELTEVIDDADERYLDLAEKVIRSLSKKQGKLASRELAQKMRQKLMQHGFVNDQINEVINFEVDEEQEQEALKIQGIKAYKRYRKDQQRIIRYLVQHGFSYSQAQAFANGEVIPFDELDEY
ncbi:MAG: RecX family transcriptional regulator [Lactobacillus sp.]|nr:RecX family transcriptional regulator [Lactobacillus sp.]